MESISLLEVPIIWLRCSRWPMVSTAWFRIRSAQHTLGLKRIRAIGSCVHQIQDHSHFVQGVAWDPLNEYLATQSSDR
jgi:hypothetical protein